VSRAEDVQALVDAAVAAHGRLDIVVNNAGVTHVNKPHLDVTEDEFDRLYRVNVKSLFHMNRAAVPAMRANPGGSSGVFVNVASTTGVRPGRGCAGIPAARARSSPPARAWRWNWRARTSACAWSTR
jgi:3-oxoacyl-[acyl-carrier protein] reductase